MMRMNNIQMKTRVKKADLFTTLTNNLTKHSEIVQEARNGYIKKAQRTLEQRLEELRQGKVVSLSFQLTPPADYSSVYKTVIDMIQWTQDETIELGPDEFRQLVQDRWDWTDNFYGSTQSYSKKAWDWVNESVGGALVPPPD